MTKIAQPDSSINVTVAGAGADADAWARALRGVDATEVHRVAAATDDDLLSALSEPGIDALAFVPPMADLPNAIRRAVMAGRHVLVAGPLAIASKQLLALDGLARRRNRVILFDTGNVADDRLAFVRKMTGGPAALWRPRYVRSLRTGVHGLASLDDLAIADIATVLSIVNATPSRVGALTPRIDDESGPGDVAMVTLAFDGGPAARVDLSFVEPTLRHEIVVACDGRSIVLDAFDVRAPLQIQAAARHRGPHRDGQWAETVSEHPLVETGSRLARAAEVFAAAVRKNDAAATNALALAAAAKVWETARASMSLGGEMLPMSAPTPLAPSQRPDLRVIKGGGHRVASTATPDLTVVAGREPA
jgi:predicted dehydrogenase